MTPTHSPTPGKQELASIIKAELIGEGAVANAIARDFVRCTTSRPADWPVGVFLRSGPNQNHAHFDRRLSEAKAQGASVVRLVLGEDDVLVVPAAKPVAPEPSTFPASAQEGSSPETSGAKP